MHEYRFLCEGQTPPPEVWNVADLLNSVQRVCRFRVHPEALHVPHAEADPRGISEALEEAGRHFAAATTAFREEYPVVITNRPLEQGYFASIDTTAAVISLHHARSGELRHSIFRFMSCSLADVILYRYKQDVPLSVHEPSIGCVCDYCDDVDQLNACLDACRFCDRCNAVITRAVTWNKIPWSVVAAVYRILNAASGRGLCFVLMPFAPSFDGVFNAIRTAVEATTNWKCWRADEVFSARDIMDSVYEHIDQADVMIADLSGKSANVFYELGFGHALEKNTILIAQSVTDIPFDLRQKQVITYNLTKEGLEVLGANLQAYLRRLSTQMHGPAAPSASDGA